MKPMLRFGAVALAASMALVPLAGADETNAPASNGKSVKAATPGDANQNRIRSIRRNDQYFRSYGRTDLTKALVTGEFVPQMSAEIVDVNLANLVGIMSGPTDRFAMLEDGTGNGFILRVGDKVRHGRITAITESSVVATVNLYGMTSRVVKRLENREG